MTDSKVQFSPPKEFVLPENVSSDGMFDAVCSFKVEDGGKLCLTKLGDTPMPGYEDDHKGSNRQDYKEYSKGMMSQMGQGQEGGDGVQY